jgi:hypothetical protein
MKWAILILLLLLSVPLIAGCGGSEAGTAEPTSTPFELVWWDLSGPPSLATPEPTPTLNVEDLTPWMRRTLYPESYTVEERLEFLERQVNELQWQVDQMWRDYRGY